MKTISVMIPCYNEEENVKAISEAVIREITTNLPSYDYEILFIDNDSTDRTREYLREICADNSKIRAIFNAKNFGQLTLRITEFARRAVTARSACAVISRIRWK